MYRYWDGRAWSAALSPHPAAPPPGSGGLGPPPVPTQPSPQVTRPRRKRPWGWLIGLGTVLAALVTVVVLVVQGIGGQDPVTSGPGGQPSTELCPEPDEATAEPQRGDGRVHAGKLSYPELGSPWSVPQPQNRVVFGKGVLIQSVEIERTPAGDPWLAAVMVGELVAGDGFFSPKDGAAIVVKCVSGTFYGESAVTRDDKRNEAIEVDGHDAWVIESQLGFNVPGIEARSERLIVVIVDTGAGSAGLFYASIPENSEQLLAPAREALVGLTVDD